ncbi:MAG: AAA family ATPase [Ignavibacteria bacterium]|nr:AAA family ATPase [Ignavibacteria bacterium]
MQESIKRGKVLEGQMVISGGPGTGKTTILIQRINFLISDTVKEYRVDLSPKDINELRNRDRSWIFFSPSELLKEYLMNLLAKEMLSPDDDRVTVWKQKKGNLFREMSL